MKRLDRQPLSPRDFSTQTNEIEAELALVRATREIWLARARGIGRDRTSEFDRDIARLEGAREALRRRARHTANSRVSKDEGHSGGPMSQAWGD